MDIRGLYDSTVSFPTHIQPVAKMSFHWPFLHWSASTVARDHVASSALLEFHRYVPGVKKDATIKASCLKNGYELKKNIGKT